MLNLLFIFLLTYFPSSLDEQNFRIVNNKKKISFIPSKNLDKELNPMDMIILI